MVQDRPGLQVAQKHLAAVDRDGTCACELLEGVVLLVREGERLAVSAPLARRFRGRPGFLLVAIGRTVQQFRTVR